MELLMPRNRNYISQSFALTEAQLDWLTQYCAQVSMQLNTKISVSIVIRMLVDDFIQQRTSADTSALVRDDDDDTEL